MSDVNSSCTVRRPRPRRTAWILAVVLLFALSSGGLGGVGAPGDAAHGDAISPTVPVTEGQKPGGQYGTRIRVELLASRGDRATGAPQTGTSDNLAPGEETTRTLFAGASDDPNLCKLGTLASGDPRDGFHLWDVRVRVMTVTPSETTLHVDWQRSSASLEAAVSESRDVLVEAGSVRVLDFVRDPNPTAACANAVLQVRADPLPSPGPQPDLVYDVWLVYEGRNERGSLRRTVVAPSGQPVPFQVGRLAWALDGTLHPATANAPVVTLAASGTLVGTLSPDGSVAVSARVVRAVAWGTAEVRGEGRIEYRGSVGDTMALALPAPEGQAGAPVSGVPLPTSAAVVQTAARTNVDFGRFFAGTQVSLYVRVTNKDR